MKIKVISSICFLLLQLAIFNCHSQDLIKTDSIAQLTAEQLKSFNVPAQNGVKAIKIIYSTKDHNNKETQASGMLLVPVMKDLANLPLVVYHHGATFHRTEVPSYGQFQVDMAAYFASNGYITLAPDYIGLGESPGLHPYMHAQTEATASADMIRAVKKMFENKYQIKLTNNLYLAGYSQGGHAVAAFHKYIEENNLIKEFNIKGSASGAGFFDMSGITLNILLNIIDNNEAFDSEIIIHLMAAYQELYGNLYNSLSDYYIYPYDSIINNYLSNDCNAYLNSLLPNIVNEFMHDSVWVNVKNNENHPIRKAFAMNDLYDWKPIAPFRFFHSLGDGPASQNSVFTYHKMKELGAENVSIEEVSPTLGHNEAMPITMKKILEWFNTLSGKN